MNVRTLFTVEAIKLRSPKVRAILLINVAFNFVLLSSSQVFTINGEDASGLNSNFFYGTSSIFLVILFFQLWSDEFRYGIFRRTICDGVQRQDYFIARLFQICLVVLLFTVIQVAEFILMKAYHGELNTVSPVSLSLEALRFFVVQLFNGALALMISVLMNGSSLAILTYLAIIGTSGLLVLYDKFTKALSGFSDYLPTRIISLYADAKIETYQTPVIAFYIMAFLLIPMLKLYRQDIKVSI